MNKNKYIFIFTLNLIVLFTISCTTINIESNKLESFSKKINKMIIVFNVHSNLSSLASACSATIERELKTKNIMVRDFVDNGLSLDSDLNNLIQEFSPDVILQVNQVEASSYKQNGLVTSTDLVFNATIFDVESKNKVWRANIELSRKNYGLPGGGDGNELAFEILKKLKEDNIL